MQASTITRLLYEKTSGACGSSLNLSVIDDREERELLFAAKPYKYISFIAYCWAYLGARLPSFKTDGVQGRRARANTVELMVGVTSTINRNWGNIRDNDIVRNQLQRCVSLCG